MIGEFNEEAGRRALEGEVSAWGHPIAGQAERPHRSERRLVYCVFWLGA